MNKIKRSLISQVPECLTTATSQSLSISISVLFALVFLTVYTPFSQTAWFYVGSTSRFLWTIIFVCVSTTFLVLSRVLTSYVVKRKKHFSTSLFYVWRAGEIVAIGCFHALISINLIKVSGFSPAFIVAKSILVTIVALGFPTLVMDLIFLLRDTRKMLMVTHSDVIESDGDTIPDNTEIINIADNRGVLKLSIRLENLYYIKSEDNYVKVFYMKQGTLTHYLLRAKIQSIDDNFQSKRSLARCHRSYIVNLNNVKGIRNEAGGFYLDFDVEGMDSIPVSKTYSQKIVTLFTNKQR
ncbi:MAG: LytTR family transcriptional regulator [Bacteroidales bacterium]|nr:LytTR family transcriptional regulator [Bacteroidales bacterium]